MSLPANVTGMIKQIQPNNRHGFADATGGLCRILKKDAIYGRLLNYFLLVKDLDYINDEKHSAIVADIAATEHDTYRIGDILRFMKENMNRFIKRSHILSFDNNRL